MEPYRCYGALQTVGGTRRIVNAAVDSGAVVRIFGSTFGSAGTIVIPHTTVGFAVEAVLAGGRQLQSTCGGFWAGFFSSKRFAFGSNV
jgi:hypothetical protein